MLCYTCSVMKWRSQSAARRQKVCSQAEQVVTLRTPAHVKVVHTVLARGTDGSQRTAAGKRYLQQFLS